VSILGFGLDTDGLSVTWSLLWTRLWSIGIYGCVPPGLRACNRGLAPAVCRSQDLRNGPGLRYP